MSEKRKLTIEVKKGRLFGYNVSGLNQAIKAVGDKSYIDNERLEDHCSKQFDVEIVSDLPAEKAKEVVRSQIEKQSSRLGTLYSISDGAGANLGIAGGAAGVFKTFDYARDNNLLGHQDPVLLIPYTLSTFGGLALAFLTKGSIQGYVDRKIHSLAGIEKAIE